MAYVQPTAQDVTTLRQMIERLGVGKVLETVAIIEADYTCTFCKGKDHAKNARLIQDCADNTSCSFVCEDGMLGAD